MKRHGVRVVRVFVWPGEIAVWTPRTKDGDQAKRMTLDRVVADDVRGQLPAPTGTLSGAVVDFA